MNWRLGFMCPHKALHWIAYSQIKCVRVPGFHSNSEKSFELFSKLKLVKLCLIGSNDWMCWMVLVIIYIYYLYIIYLYLYILYIIFIYILFIYSQITWLDAEQMPVTEGIQVGYSLRLVPSCKDYSIGI